MSLVRSVSNRAAALGLVRESATRHTAERGGRLSRVAAELHKNAPRGGKYFNSKGQPRSAPGEVPAMEFGDLYREIQQGVETTPLRTTVIVNRVKLEFGDTSTMVAPRPLGEKALAQFKSDLT